MDRPPVSVESIKNTLINARRAGRRIVPIIGAGLSADSGFPVLDAINRYFGKLHQYIAIRGYLAPGTTLTSFDPLTAEAEEYPEQPWKFIQRFHWPDRFQLNQDLLSHLGRAGHPGSISEAVRRGQLAILGKINPERKKWYEAVCTSVQSAIPEGVADANLRRSINEAFAGRGPWNTPFDLLGDWRKVIQYLTHYQSDDADALFARFGLNRQPALGHRFLAFLVRELQVQTIFTFNFDTLIEQSLVDAGLRPEVFAMEGGVGIPSHTHLRDHLSVIKLHGSTHAILVDERLDHPLSDVYKERFDAAVGEHPLLFVIGCSGGDHRLRDLVEHVLSRSGGKTGPAVVWLHYEEKAPNFLAMAPADVQLRGTNNPGLTLSHLHALLTGIHPASEVPYLAHIERPIKLELPDVESDLPNQPKIDPNAPDPGYLFTSLEVPSDRPPVRSASHQLFLLASHLARKGFHTIWVDLESVHTLAGVVGTIIDQCRGYDPTLPPTVMPLGEDQAAFKTSIRTGVARVRHALGRTRYFLAFDGLETYVWPATTHHGWTRVHAKDAPGRLQRLTDFIAELAKLDLGESRLAVSVDRSKPRHAGANIEEHLGLEPVHLGDQFGRGPLSGANIEEHLGLEQRVQELAAVKYSDSERLRFTLVLAAAGDITYAELIKDAQKGGFPLALPNDGGDGVGNTLLRIPEGSGAGGRERLGMLLFSLSCFRRTRSLVSLQLLLKPFLGDERVVQDALNALGAVPALGVLRLEGGGYWFNRTVRDHIYSLNTDGSDQLIKACCGEERPGADQFRVTVSRLLLHAVLQQQIARIYYTHTFVQSHDTFALLEFTYHRVSSIRSLVKLLFLIVTVDKHLDSARAIIEGIREVGRFLIGTFPGSGLESLGAAFEFKADEVVGVKCSVSKLLWEKSDTSLKDVEVEEELKAIRGEFERRHARELHSLCRVWMRSEARLRAALPAEQLLNWCDNLLDDELKYRSNRVVVRYGGDLKIGFTPLVACLVVPPTAELAQPAAVGTPHPTAIWSASHNTDDPRGVINRDAETIVSDFRFFLTDFKAKLLIERSDYAACIETRWAETGPKVGGQPVPTLQPKAAFEALRLDDCDWRDVHNLLDIAVCFIKWAQATPGTDRDLADKLAPAQRLLERLRTHLVNLEPKATGGEAHEAHLRLLHLEAEVHLQKASVFSHEGLSGDWKSFVTFRSPADGEDSRPNLAVAEQCITEGLSRVRVQDPQASRPPRSVVVDPTPDGALYLQYRSAFHMLRGRVTWMRTGEGKLTAGTWTTVEAGFDEAARAFEMARGGLGTTNPLLAGLAELYAVEARLARARLMLHPNNWVARNENGNEQTPYHPIDESRGHYEAARAGLQQARQHFLSGRRNVIWWRLFFRVVAQYHADRLALGYARLAHRCLASKQSGDYHPDDRSGLALRASELPEFLHRLRRGYHALRSAVDYNLPVDGAEGVSVWLRRMWWELTLSGYAFWRLAIRAKSDRNGTELLAAQTGADKYVTEQLGWLSTSAMLINSDGVKTRLDSVIKQDEFGPLRVTVPYLGDDQTEAAPLTDGVLQRWCTLRTAAHQAAINPNLPLGDIPLR